MAKVKANTSTRKRYTENVCQFKKREMSSA